MKRVHIDDKAFKDVKPNGIFAAGVAYDSPDALHMTGNHQLLMWVAVKGENDDWAIYCGEAWKRVAQIASEGDKVNSHQFDLIDCSDELKAKYRH